MSALRFLPLSLSLSLFHPFLNFFCLSLWAIGAGSDLFKIELYCYEEADAQTILPKVSRGRSVSNSIHTVEFERYLAFSFIILMHMMLL